jgi:hypothetical protein
MSVIASSFFDIANVIDTITTNTAIVVVRHRRQ